MKFDFFKTINNIRNIIGKYNVLVIVILDGYSGHFNEEVKEFLTSKNIMFKFIVLHSNNITQFVDLNLFYIVKVNLISTSSCFEFVVQNKSWEMNEEDEETLNIFLRRKYYQVTNRNEYVEQRIVDIMKNYVECKTQSKIKSTFR